MHKNRVFHRVCASLIVADDLTEYPLQDISTKNVAINHDGIYPLIILSGASQPLLSTFDMHVAFIDFGISVRFPHGTAQESCTSTDLCGTFEFLAPEVLGHVKDGPLVGQPYQLGPVDVSRS